MSMYRLLSYVFDLLCWLLYITFVLPVCLPPHLLFWTTLYKTRVETLLNKTHLFSRTKWIFVKWQQSRFCRTKQRSMMQIKLTGCCWDKYYAFVGCGRWGDGRWIDLVRNVTGIHRRLLNTVNTRCHRCIQLLQLLSPKLLQQRLPVVDKRCNYRCNPAVS